MHTVASWLSNHKLIVCKNNTTNSLMWVKKSTNGFCVLYVKSSFKKIGKWIFRGTMSLNVLLKAAMLHLM